MVMMVNEINYRLDPLHYLILYLVFDLIVTYDYSADMYNDYGQEAPQQPEGDGVNALNL
jgi:hypothetical protein